MRLASRLGAIEPFYVMEMAKAAHDFAASAACDPVRGGEPMIYLNIGEPDFSAPAEVVQAAQAFIAGGRTHYTQAPGIAPLRQAIASWYAQRWNVDVAHAMRAWDAVAVGEYKNVAQAQAAQVLYNRGNYDAV